MSFWDSLLWTESQPPGWVTALLAIVIFVWLYSAAQRRSTQAEQSRLNHLDRSIELYTAAAGPLMRSSESLVISTQMEQVLIDKLQSCKAAPYLTDTLQGQIVSYLMDLDPTRLPLLGRTLDRETLKLLEERKRLLIRRERPGWGLSLWLLIKPAIPFLFIVVLFLLLRLLSDDVNGLYELTNSQANWLLISIYSKFISCVLSLLLLYMIIMSNRRPVEGAIIYHLLSLSIALLSLGHFYTLTSAPYILGAQIVIFLSGFRLLKPRPRKTRPFVGHYSVQEEKVEELAGDVQHP